MSSLLCNFIGTNRRFLTMKILKICVFLLVPALGFVACQKSNIQPANPASTPAATVAAPEQVNANTTEASYTEEANYRMTESESVLEDDGNITGVVASGDDDRDGGDKKQKKVSR